MFARMAVFAAAVGGLLAVARPAAAEDQPPGKADPTATLLAKLRQPIGLKTPPEMKLEVLADLLEDKLGIPIVINEASFGGSGMAVAAIDFPPIRMPRAKGLSVADTLHYC